MSRARAVLILAPLLLGAASAAPPRDVAIGPAPGIMPVGMTVIDVNRVLQRSKIPPKPWHTLQPGAAAQQSPRTAQLPGNTPTR